MDLERHGKLTAQAIFDAYARTPATSEGWRVKIGDPGPVDLLNSPIYTRGAMTLHALRKRIGDDDFFRLLRLWAHRCRQSFNASDRLSFTGGVAIKCVWFGISVT